MPIAVLAPPLFVLLWSSAIVSAKYGLPDADPLTFLFIRFVLVALAFAALALVFRAAWPSSWRQVLDIAVVGALVHGVYLSGVFIAISIGLPAAVASLIVGLQPILTALLAGRMLGEAVFTRQWIGLGLGLTGVGLVLWERLTLEGLSTIGVAFCVLSLICIAIGTLYQKRYAADMPLLAGSVIQAATACILTGIGAVLFEPMRVDWTSEFILSLGWLVIGVSLGAFSLLMVMIKQGAAVKVASLFYLVPPTTAVMAWLGFNEQFGLLAVLGIAIAAVGIALVVRPPKPVS